MRARDAVITAPHRVPPLRRSAFAGLTLMAWSAFAWLLTPLVTLLLWTVGLRTAYDEAVQRLGDVDGGLLLTIAASTTALCVTLLAWAAVQRRRFRGRDRRARPADVTAHDVARALGAPTQAAAVLRTASVTVVHLDDGGAPVRAVVGGVPAGIPAQRPAAPARSTAAADLLPAGG
jgi:poly-beta-1,6-N-acetyl-D-glucosamine biosynthesis protein PgaD